MKTRRSSNASDNRAAVVVGASAGGMSALGKLLAALPAGFDRQVVVVQHLYPHSQSNLHRYLDGRCRLPVREAQDKQKIQPGIIYTAPANYHLLIEEGRHFALNVDAKENYSRPSIDVLFETAARVWQRQLVGVLLTGANADGTRGLAAIRLFGGLSVVQDPAEAEFPAMPQAAIDAGVADRVDTLSGIGSFLARLS